MFGVPYCRLDLALLPNYESEIPVVLTVLCAHLRYNKGFEMEGIFRKTGREQTFLDCMSRLDLGHCLSDIECDSYIVAQLIKAFFREYQIPSPGFFSDALLNSNQDEQIIEEFDKLEVVSKSLILWLVDLLFEVVSHTKSNKMSIESLAICFSPNLCRHYDPSQLLLLQRSAQSLLLRLCELREVLQEEEKGKEEEEKYPETHGAFSVRANYRASLNSGVYGSYHYLPNENRERPQSIRRSDVIHTKEVLYQALGIQYQPCFQLKYIGDLVALSENKNQLDLTKDEREKIENFGNLLSSRYNYENIAYSELVRFVIGCKLRIPVAERRFLNLKKLEREYKLNDIELSSVRNELQKECYMLCGRDLKNNAIVGFRICKWDKKRMNISVMMKALMVWIDSISSDLDICRNGIVLLFDMRGLNKDNMSLDLEKVFLQAFQDCYPMRICKFIICDAPVLIRAVIQIGKLVLSKKLSSRIVSVKSTENTGSLWKYVDHTQVPKCLNGRFDEVSDQSEPTNAWQFVCSKVVGDSSNIIELATNKLQPPTNENDNDNDNVSDSDREYMKQKTLPFEKGNNANNNKTGKTMFGKLSSGVKSVRSGVNKGMSKAKTGVSDQMMKAKTKLKQKRDDMKATKPSEDPQPNDPPNDHEDDDKKENDNQ
eukprot:91542_1